MFGKKKEEEEAKPGASTRSGSLEKSTSEPQTDVGDEAAHESTENVDTLGSPGAAAGRLAPETAGTKERDVADVIAESMTKEGLEYLRAEMQEETGTPGEKKRQWVPTVTKDEAVSYINNLVVEGLEGISRQIGTYIIDKLAGGDYLAILRGNIKKSRLFNEILDDDELMIDSKRLYEFSIAEGLRRQCLAERMDVPNLKTYHFVAAYRVKDEEARLLLLDEANQNKWGVRRLLREASEFRKKKSGIDVGKSILKMIGTPLKALEDPELVTMCSDKDRLLRVLSESERQQIRNLIVDGKPQLEGWKHLIEQLNEVLSDLDEE